MITLSYIKWMTTALFLQDLTTHLKTKMIQYPVKVQKTQ